MAKEFYTTYADKPIDQLPPADCSTCQFDERYRKKEPDLQNPSPCKKCKAKGKGHQFPSWRPAPGTGHWGLACDRCKRPCTKYDHCAKLESVLPDFSEPWCSAHNNFRKFVRRTDR